ncbi:unnamed protein product [Amoebophrya sp. A25]|nr:unnamed protein product [Amoebophrya sp. A25]|eukprot:GSA25T00001943001.1
MVVHHAAAIASGLVFDEVSGSQSEADTYAHAGPRLPTVCSASMGAQGACPWPKKTWWGLSAPHAEILASIRAVEQDAHHLQAAGGVASTTSQLGSAGGNGGEENSTSRLAFSASPPELGQVGGGNMASNIGRCSKTKEAQLLSIGQTVFPRYPKLSRVRLQRCSWPGAAKLGTTGELNGDHVMGGQEHPSKHHKQLNNWQRLPYALRELLTLLFSSKYSHASSLSESKAPPTPSSSSSSSSPTAFILDKALDLKGNFIKMMHVANGFPIGPNATEIGEPNIYPLQECDPAGRIPTAVQGKWCVADMIDQTDINGPFAPTNVGLIPKMYAKLSNAVGDRRFSGADKEYPLNNICIPHLPADFCRFTKHRDLLPGNWRHGFAKMKEPWWEESSPLPYPSMLSSKERNLSAPYGHGQMLYDKARLLSSVDPAWPDHRRIEESSLSSRLQSEAQTNLLNNKTKDQTDAVELPANAYATRAPHLNIAGNRGAKSQMAFRPSDGLTKFWVANPDSMYVDEDPTRNIRFKFTVRMVDPTNLVDKMKGAFAGQAMSQPVWEPPTLVLDEGEDCCADGCRAHIGKPFCVTEAEIRRYFEQADHMPPPDLINCAASDSQICDSLHGDARDTDDHWGLGWLQAMRRWNTLHGPMPPRDELQQERKDALSGTPGDIDFKQVLRGKLMQEAPHPAPDYVPPDYDALANTSSFAVYSVTGRPAPVDQPAAIRSEKLNDNLTFNVEKIPFLRGWRPYV